MRALRTREGNALIVFENNAYNIDTTAAFDGPIIARAADRTERPIASGYERIHCNQRVTGDEDSPAPRPLGWRFDDSCPKWARSRERPSRPGRWRPRRSPLESD